MKEQLILTHDGKFHVDEIFAIAILSKFILKKKVKSLKIIRTRDEKTVSLHQKNKETYVIDVGECFDSKNKNFDHHQSDPNLVWDKQLIHFDQKFDKILLSACGLVWKEFLSNYASDNEYSDEEIKRMTLIAQQVDLCDNGLIPWDMTPIFSGYNTYKESNSKIDYQKFRDALVEVEKFLDNVINDFHSDEKNVVLFVKEKFEKYIKKNEIEEKLEKEMNDIVYGVYFNMIVKYLSMFSEKDKCKMEESLTHFFDNVKSKAELIIEGNVAIKDALELAIKEGHGEIVLFNQKSYHARSALREMSEETLLFATHYPEDNEWTIMSVNKEKDNPYIGKILMPETWAGKRKEDLENISGYKGMFYCHKLRFLTIFRGSKEDCIKICREIIDISRR